MKTNLLFVGLFLVTACSVQTATAPAPVPTPTQPSAVAPSICHLPDGLGVCCDGNTPHSQAWTWIDTSPTVQNANDGGEVSARCNEQTCPSGATCVVQNELNNGTVELVMGTCE